MLYQTLSFSFQLNPSSSSSISSFSSTSLPCTLVNEKENHMAFVEQKALKTSFWPETGLKSSQQIFPEDFWCGNGGNGGVGVSGDDLFVDGLLDFSNEDVCVEDDDEKGFCFSHAKGSEEDEEQKGSMKEEFGSVGSVGSVLPPSELTVPVEELANLEWLSNFVEESDFSEYSLQHFQPVKPQIPNENRSEPETPVYKTGFLSSVPAKARSKRSRTGGRVWSLGSLPNTDSSSSSYSSSHSSSPSSSSSSSCLISNRTGYELFSYLGKPPKKPKRKPVSFSEAYHHDHMLFHHFNQYHHRQQQQQQQQQRRCTHCGVQKTPQWRTGPMGAKTLCNACGVRYKSGRLLPEYRPACSPTFSSEVHSNNHRKVLEMRRKKEMQVRPSYLSGSA